LQKRLCESQAYVYKLFLHGPGTTRPRSQKVPSTPLIIIYVRHQLMSTHSLNSRVLQLQRMCLVKVWTYCLFTVQRCFILYWFVVESIFVIRENRVESAAASQICSTFLNYSVCFELKIPLKSCFWCVLDNVLITWACQKLNFYVVLALTLCDVSAWKKLCVFCMHPRGFSLWTVDMVQFNW